MGITLRVNGEDKILKHKSYLIMGNHQSLFDIFVVPAAIPLCFTGIEAERHFSYPFWGYIIRKWGCISIARYNLDSAKKSLNLAQKTIENGMSIAVMPEGHRTITGQMATFKKGAFHLAKAAKADILPFGIHGLYQFNKKGVAKLNGKKKGFTYFSKGYEDLYKTKLSIDFSGLRANTGLDKLIEELNQVDILSMSGFVDFETNSLYITYVAAHLFEQLIEFDIGD